MAKSKLNLSSEPKPDDPTGNFCQFCGYPNDAWDDCGYWYLWPNRGISIGRIACWSCYNGEPGNKHRERYGVGER
jgi:hypothetical protein